MKIIYVASEFYPAKISSSHLYDDLFSYFVKLGHSVDVITSNPRKGLSAKEKKTYNNNMTISNPGGFNVKIHKSKIYIFGFLRKLYDFFFLGNELSKIIAKDDFDCIIIPSFPPIFFQQKLIKVAKLKKAIIVYNMHDLYPDNILKKNNVFYKLLNHLNCNNLEMSDYIISISDDLTESIIQKGISEKKIIRLNLWPLDERENTQVEIPDYISSKITNQKFNVFYIGNLGRFQNIKLLLSLA